MPSHEIVDFVRPILRSKTSVSSSEAGASKPLTGFHEGRNTSNDRGFYEKEFGCSAWNADFARPVSPALQLSLSISAGPYHRHREDRFA
jgi:hypothetical protein